MASISAGLWEPPSMLRPIRVVALSRVLRIASSAFITPMCGAGKISPVGVVAADLSMNSGDTTQL